MNPTFFGLTFSLKSQLLEEFWGCMELFKLSYTEVLKIPVYVRKFMIGLKIKQKEGEQEYYEKAKVKNNGGRRLSGDTLKENLYNNNNIPT